MLSAPRLYRPTSDPCGAAYIAGRKHISIRPASSHLRARQDGGGGIYYLLTSVITVEVVQVIIT